MAQAVVARTPREPVRGDGGENICASRFAQGRIFFWGGGIYSGWRRKLATGYACNKPIHSDSNNYIENYLYFLHAVNRC